MGRCPRCIMGGARRRRPAVPGSRQSRRESRAVSELIVITFDDEQQAGQALRSLRGLERQGLLKLDDTAVVVKDRGGSVRTRNELSSATETGAVVGAVVGGLLTF